MQAVPLSTYRQICFLLQRMTGMGNLARHLANRALLHKSLSFGNSRLFSWIVFRLKEEKFELTFQLAHSPVAFKLERLAYEHPPFSPFVADFVFVTDVVMSGPSFSDSSIIKLLGQFVLSSPLELDRTCKHIHILIMS